MNHNKQQEHLHDQNNLQPCYYFELEFMNHSIGRLYGPMSKRFQLVHDHLKTRFQPMRVYMYPLNALDEHFARSISNGSNNINNSNPVAQLSSLDTPTLNNDDDSSFVHVDTRSNEPQSRIVLRLVSIHEQSLKYDFKYNHCCIDAKQQFKEDAYAITTEISKSDHVYTPLTLGARHVQTHVFHVFVQEQVERGWFRSVRTVDEKQMGLLNIYTCSIPYDHVTEMINSLITRIGSIEHAIHQQTLLLNQLVNHIFNPTMTLTASKSLHAIQNPSLMTLLPPPPPPLSCSSTKLSLSVSKTDQVGISTIPKIDDTKSVSPTRIDQNDKSFCSDCTTKKTSKHASPNKRIRSASLDYTDLIKELHARIKQRYCE